MLSALVCVVLPTVVAGLYLYFRAADQFASTVGFSVRKEEVASPVEFLGGIADFSSSGSSDADILNAYIGSQELVRILENRLTLSAIFARPVDDIVFGFRPGGPIESLSDYWDRMVRVLYDPGTGLIEVRALAFDPKEAREIATAIFEECARLVDEMSAIAREDTTAFAREELERAVERLKQARENLTEFRSETQIVDPSADLQGQMGLLSTLEQQLAAALIDADLLRESTRAQDPRLKQAERRIMVIEARIEAERQNLGVGGGQSNGRDYATLLAEYERLAVDREFAEQAYTGALAAYDQAQAEARRKSRYLVAHIKPTLAETPEYPQRLILLVMTCFFLTCIWAIAVLIFYSIRDRR